MKRKVSPFSRNRNVRCGALCIRGNRLTPVDVINMAFWGGVKNMLLEYPGVTEKQAEECWHWAARILKSHVAPRNPRRAKPKS